MDTSQHISPRKGRDAEEEAARDPRPLCGFSTPVPILRHLHLGKAEVGEGWKPADRAAEADARRRFPSNARPAPRGAPAPGSRGQAAVAMAARPLHADAGVVCRKPGPWGLGGLASGVHIWFGLCKGPSLALACGHVEAPSRQGAWPGLLLANWGQLRAWKLCSRPRGDWRGHRS